MGFHEAQAASQAIGVIDANGSPVVERRVFAGYFNDKWAYRLDPVLNADGRYGVVTDEERHAWSRVARDAPSLSNWTCLGMTNSNLWFKNLNGQRVRITIEVLGEGPEER